MQKESIRLIIYKHFNTNSIIHIDHTWIYFQSQTLDFISIRNTLISFQSH